MKISQFLGKRIIGENGKDGYVLSVNTNGESLYFVCADSEEREFAVDMQNVTGFGDSILYNGAESDKKAFTPVRLGKAAFDMRGNYLGNLEDFTLSGGKLKSAKIGKKNYPVEGLIFGDVIIVKDLRRLKSDVVKDGSILFKKGAYITDEVLVEAVAAGEYVQTTLKSL